MDDTILLWQQEINRAGVYRLLADLFRLPQTGLDQTLAELEDRLVQLKSGSRKAAGALRRTFAAQAHDLVPLEVDYAQLFAGPFLVLAPPYGSIYLDGERRLMGPSTVDVREHYRGLGLDLAPDFKEAPDHVAAELEFMYALICQAAIAIAEADRPLLLDSLERQQVFLARHLGAWVPDLSARIFQHAKTDFYRHLADVVQIFVAEDLEALAELRLTEALAPAAP
jgi:TorA maturation chaperone TorD